MERTCEACHAPIEREQTYTYNHSGCTHYSPYDCVSAAVRRCAEIAGEKGAWCVESGNRLGSAIADDIEESIRAAFGITEEPKG